MQTKTVQEIGQELGYGDNTTRQIIERLVRDGKLRVVTSTIQDTAVPGHEVITELLTRGDTVSLRAAALIQLLTEQCERYEHELAEWHQVKQGCISDMIDPATNTRLILSKRP